MNLRKKFSIVVAFVVIFTMIVSLPMTTFATGEQAAAQGTEVSQEAALADDGTAAAEDDQQTGDSDSEEIDVISDYENEETADSAASQKQAGEAAQQETLAIADSYTAKTVKASGDQSVTITPGSWIYYSTYGFGYSWSTCRFYVTSKSTDSNPYFNKAVGFCLEPQKGNPGSGSVSVDRGDTVLARICAYALNPDVGFFALEEQKNSITFGSNGNYSDAAYTIGHIAASLYYFGENSDWDYRTSALARTLARNLVAYAKQTPSKSFSKTTLKIAGCYEENGALRQKTEEVTYSATPADPYTTTLPSGVKLHTKDGVQEGTVTIEAGTTFYLSAPYDTTGTYTSAAATYLANPSTSYVVGAGSSVQELGVLLGNATKASTKFTVTWANADATASVNITGTKELKGRPVQNGEFQFAIKNGNTVVSEGSAGADGKITFAPISYSIKDIGKTYTYTVEEINGGKTLEGVTYDNAKKTFTVKVGYENGKLTTEVSESASDIKFTNEYNASAVSVNFEGLKTLEGRDLKAGEFEFALKADGKELETVTNAADGTIAFSKLTYTEPGKYQYTISEKTGLIGGITYDKTVQKVTVTVTDNLKGKLQASVEYADGENFTFTNKYEAKATNVQFKGTKVLEGNKPLEAGDFNFTLTGTGITEKITVSNDADGTITFPVLTLDKTGEYNYKIKEEVTGIFGITYDKTVKEITVTVTDDLKGQLIVELKEEGSDNFQFTNSYKAQGTTASIQALKTLEGRQLKEGEFSFQLKDEDGNTVETVTNAENGTISFSEIPYTEVGEYTYTISEVKGSTGGVSYTDEEETVVVTVTDDLEGYLHATVSYENDKKYATFNNTYKAAKTEVQLEGSKTLEGRDLKKGEFEFVLAAADGEILETVTNGADGTIEFDKLTFTKAGEYTYTISEVEGSLGGVSYDDTVYTAVVKVTDDGEGHLNAEVTYNGEKTFQFKNTYAAKEVSKAVGVDKNLTGIKELESGMFTFTKVECDADGNALEGADAVSAVNDAEGEVNFPAVTYTEAGTHYYAITEDHGGKTLDGVKYDDMKVIVKVTVTDDLEGHLQAKVSYPDDIVFDNAYTTDDAENQISVDKNLTGRKALEAGMFDFTKVECDKDGDPLKGAEKETAANAADGSVNFAVDTYEEPGTHYYLITEGNAGETIDGIRYDDMEVIVKVEVKDNEKGALVATTTYPEDTEFDNAYSAKAANVQFGGTKVLEGRDLKAGEFEFVLKADGKDLETVTNAADGTITFSQLTYTEPGEYQYTISEKTGLIGGITYDKTIQKVTVTVTDDGVGSLHASVDYETKGQLEFVNIYEAKATSVILKAKKTLEGRDLAAGEYQFTLSEGEEVLETVTNAADGTITFSEITYTKSGEHTYTISEVKGDAEGVTYDENTYKVTVKVTDDGQGNLVAEVISDNEDIVFSNTYKGVGSITVTKVFTLNDKETAIDTSFAVGLFSDAECTQKAVRADGSQVADQMIVLAESSVGSVTFDGLEYGTYYVAELDKDGNALTEGDVTGRLEQSAYKQVVSYENEEVVLDKDNKSAEDTVITNGFYDELYYKSGSLTVTKVVTVNGTPTKCNGTYYVALFEDEVLTSIISDVKAIDMNDQSEASVTFDKLSLDTTYYVAETDAAGNVLEAGDFNIQAISVENGVIAITANAVAQEAVITNDYGEDYWEEEDESDSQTEEEESEVSEQEAQTGDDLDMGLYGALMLLAALVMAVAAGRKKGSPSRG